ncbi:tudor domain-containing protein 15-like [Gouania willdenowi]|uniref:tudor domain-containing protein 15-like n=1 Tax=Gouania willdenowi TaxID=441366 RepID=UPI00105459A3|nr:tudor domain-containing protein 15-like [Gouania willdenowi]
MLPNQSLENLRSQDSKVSKESLLWSVNLKLTHLDWTPEATLVHFQGHYLNTCELDYKILHGEIQRTAKTKAEVDIGEFCLVEDVTSASWFRGRVQGQTNDLFEVYLIDHGNILTVDATYRPHVSSELFTLPPKVVCGFFANVLLVRNCPHLLVDKYFSCLVGQSITGYVQARLPYEVLVLEVPDINSDLVLHGFGRLVDRDTFLLLVELLTEVTVKRSMESEIDTPFDQSKEVELFIKPSFWTKYKDVLKCAESKLICGTRAKVQLTAALYHRMFFFQMVGVERELCKISEKLALMCEHGNQQQRRGSAEKISLLCSVKGKDGNWYRGFLSFFPVSSHVKVLFVDYGFFETVSVDNIRRLPEEFLLTPIMALPCSLSMKGQVKMPKSQLLNLLKSSLQGGVLDVEISGFDDEHHLYYLTVSGVEDDPVKEPQPFQMAPLTKAESLSEGNQLSTQQDLMNKEFFFRKLLEEAMTAEGLGADSVFEGFVVGAQNPNKFWIRTQKRNDEFNEMMAGIGDYFRQVKLDEEILLNPEPRDLCCAMYEKDMHFYRAVVTDKLVHGAEVLFIDFGNIEKVPTMLIKNIPKAFAKIPGFAIDCTLANLILCDDIWPVAVCDFFRQAVFNKSLQVHVVQMEKNQLAVDLNEMERGESQSIAKLLVTSDKAEYISLKSVVHSDANETKNVKYSQKRATAIGRTTKQIKKSNKNDKKAPVARTFKALEIKPGWMLTIRCFSFISVKDFWCQSLNKASELKVLNDKIHQYYSAHTVALQAEDSCCVAKSPVDNKWYRGLITERENRFATVLLVDYGYTIQVDQQYLQAIMPEFVHLERQAFRCCLYNPQTSAGFKDFCDWSPVMCKLKTLCVTTLMVCNALWFRS